MLLPSTALCGAAVATQAPTLKGSAYYSSATGCIYIWYSDLTISLVTNSSQTSQTYLWSPNIIFTTIVDVFKGLSTAEASKYSSECYPLCGFTWIQCIFASSLFCTRPFLSEMPFFPINAAFLCFPSTVLESSCHSKGRGIPGRQHHHTAPLLNRQQKITPAFQPQQQQPIGFGQVSMLMA